MNVLVINAGSSSIKYQLINMENEKELAKGIAERIGFDNSVLKHKPDNKDAYIVKQAMENHDSAMKLVLECLTHPVHGVIEGLDQISAVGHRVVHGGEKYSASVKINETVMETLQELVPLAPLHNPANILGIRACQREMPNTPMVAVFDTAFHHTIQKHAYLYGIPYEDYTDLKVRKYGFHGTSHHFLSRRVAKLLGKPVEQLKIITCHLGNGASVAAVKYGESIDTSMGLTPLEGLIMGTRCGDIDAGAVIYIMEKHGFNSQQLNDYLNKKSGVLGLSGISNDFRDLEAAAVSGNKHAALVRLAFCYRIKKYIGAYTAVMDGVDAIVFAGGVGETNPDIRYNSLADMNYLGIKIDSAANEIRGKEICISARDSKVAVWSIPTNEELTIARETYEMVNAN